LRLFCRFALREPPTEHSEGATPTSRRHDPLLADASQTAGNTWLTSHLICVSFEPGARINDQKEAEWNYTMTNQDNLLHVVRDSPTTSGYPGLYVCSMKKRIFIVDDYPLMRRGYGAQIGREADLVACGDAGSVQEAIAKFPAEMPDLLICDISIGGASGIALVRQLRLQHPDLPVLFISMHDEPSYVDRAFAVGACGYMVKSEVDRNLIDAIRCVLSGGFWASDRATV
jgi:CheY-like chemotaxis protein